MVARCIVLVPPPQSRWQHPSPEQLGWQVGIPGREGALDHPVRDPQPLEDRPDDDGTGIGDQPLRPRLDPQRAVGVRGEECERFTHWTQICMQKLPVETSEKGELAFSSSRYADSVDENDRLKERSSRSNRAGSNTPSPKWLA